MSRRTVITCDRCGKENQHARAVLNEEYPHEDRDLCPGCMVSAIRELDHKLNGFPSHALRDWIDKEKKRLAEWRKHEPGSVYPPAGIKDAWLTNEGGKGAPGAS